MNLTINEIARLAGVSKGTVSKVLNNYSGINEKTRERVQKVVKQMGYERNSAAQALALKRTGIIGLLVPHDPDHSLDGDYWSALVTAVTGEATMTGYNVVLLMPKREGNLEELFSSITRKRQLDGLIIIAEILDKKHLATLISSDTPFVMLGRNPDFTHHAVDIDNRAAAREMTQYMLDHAYKKILFVAGPEEFYYSKERQAGYSDAMSKAGNYQAHVYLPYYDRQEMRLGLKTAIETHKPDSVLIGAGGGFMFDALATLKEMALKAPKFGIATFDDYRYLDFLSIPITAVRQPIAEIGHASVQLLAKLISSPPAGTSQNVLLNTSIVSRKSCREP